MAKNYQSILPCTVCLEEGEGKVCFHHVKTRKSGGPDLPWNMMPLCFRCHEEIHRIGLSFFTGLYSQAAYWLLQNGWDYEPQLSGWIHPGANHG